MIRALLVFLFLAAPGKAETARILSGEHGDFTRLVIELPEPSEWIVGRTARGYAFATKDELQPDYDTSAIWQRISQTRLQAVRIDPTTGVLDISLACDCHIFPFEYRPGVIVLDIKPGRPPATSAFEADFPVGRAKPATSRAKDAIVGYDWLRQDKRFEKTNVVRSLPLPLDTGAVSLDPLRDELLEQLARGAVEGIVDMAMPGKPKPVPDVDSGVLPWSQIRVGEQPGLVVLDPDAFEEGTTPAGECPANDILDLPAWGGSVPTLDLLAGARSGLYGEFDSVDAESVLRSVRSLLYLGFGAEADQHADLIDPSEGGEELALYRSMAILVDGGTDPDTPFATMLDCDGPADLWAALANDRLPRKGMLNRDAVLQAFLGLPGHLRDHLGVGLAEKFLAQGDAEAARLIRDAMERGSALDKGAVEVLDAKVSLVTGDVDAAQSHAEAAVALDGDDVGSLIALVEAHFRKLEPMAPGPAEALLALQGETDGAEIDRALVLALALSGRTDAAFDNAENDGTILADLWRAVLDRATDDAFLNHAVGSAPSDRPEIAPEVRLGVAKRLLALGFPDAAIVWLGKIGPDDPPERRIAAASAELARGDARAAVLLLGALNDAAAAGLRAKALVQLDNLSAAGSVLIAAGQPGEAMRLGLWERDWAGLDPETPELWLQAAGHALSAAPDENVGLLARGGKSLEDSLAARNAVEALLSTVPPPEGD